MVINYLLRALIYILLVILGRLQVTGRENIPATGPYLIVVNHMSITDPPVLWLTFPPMKLRFFAGEKWESHFLFGPIMKAVGAIYINRGEVDRRALREAMAAIRDGSIFGLAPEGTRSRVGQMIEARDGAAYLASRTNAVILPVGVVNTDRVANNIRHLRRTRFEAHIGQPFTLPETGRRLKGKELEAATHLIMVHIATLIPERYHGFYAGSPALEALQRGEDPWPHALQAVGVEAEPEPQR
jgi:1-acyl-sn-glycerol-3-phosphate acyltransferase